MRIDFSTAAIDSWNCRNYIAIAVRSRRKNGDFEMKRLHRLIACSLLLILVCSVPSYGWFNLGHMAVAYVAYQQLTPEKKDRVDALLRLNPDRKNWLKLIPQNASKEDRRMMIFMIAATWPDRIKKLKNIYKNDTKNGDVPDGKASNSRNIGYQDHFLHKYWHFIDTPFSQDGTAFPNKIPKPNAETQIAAFRLVLASNKSNALKSYDLSWLLHLVGDIHQPLHCVTRFGATQKNGDAGGNFVKLCSPPCKDELHAFWDGLPGDSDDPLDAINVGKNLPMADQGLADDLLVAHWLIESVNDAKQFVYVPPIGLGAGPFTITDTYRTTAKQVADKRVALAGARLARILNQELK
ncbi:MAG: S1/P1 nuclease [Acidobacteria bacterium]|nr:MAG: S1/P1 nuclease [Acidobacteriota bacterium]